MHLDPDRIIQERAVRGAAHTWHVAIHEACDDTIQPPFEVAVTETGPDGHRRVIDERYAVDLDNAVSWANHFLADPNIIVDTSARRGVPAFAVSHAPCPPSDNPTPVAPLAEVLFR